MRRQQAKPRMVSSSISWRSCEITKSKSPHFGNIAAFRNVEANPDHKAEFHLILLVYQLEHLAKRQYIQECQNVYTFQSSSSGDQTSPLLRTGSAPNQTCCPSLILYTSLLIPRGKFYNALRTGVYFAWDWWSNTAEGCKVPFNPYCSTYRN
jgi:hypothetical protein